MHKKVMHQANTMGWKKSLEEHSYINAPSCKQDVLSFFLQAIPNEIEAEFNYLNLKETTYCS